MSFNLSYIIKKRESIFFVLTTFVFLTFTISYALNSISLFLFIPFFFLDKKQRIKEKLFALKKNKTVILFVSFFLVQAIGITYSQDINFAIKRTLVMLPLLFLPAILFVEELDKKKFDKLLCLLKYAIPLTFLFYVIIHCFIDKRAINTFVHFTVTEKIKISQFYLAFIVMVPIVETLRQIQKQQKLVINGLILIIALGILLLLGNKTIVVFLVILSLGILYNLIKTDKKKALIATIAIVLIVLLGSQLTIIKNKMGVFFKTTDFNLETIITKNKYTHTKNTAEHRFLIDYLSIKEIKDALPFGVGTGDFQEALNKEYEKINFKAAIKEGYNNHNQYLSEFLKTGILGGLLFITLIVFLWNTPKSTIGYYFLLFFTLGCLVESYLDRQHGVVIFAFIIPFFIKNEYN